MYDLRDRCARWTARSERPGTRGGCAERASRTPERNVSFRAGTDSDDADDRLLRVALDNLIGNAWNFTRPAKVRNVELGSAPHNGLATVVE